MARVAGHEAPRPRGPWQGVGKAVLAGSRRRAHARSAYWRLLDGTQFRSLRAGRVESVGAVLSVVDGAVVLPLP